MSLPKKRKCLSPEQALDRGGSDGTADEVRTDIPKPPEENAPHLAARSRQMDDAFAIVDHMEHSRGVDTHDASGMSTGFQQSPPGRPDAIRLRLSLGSDAPGNHHEYMPKDSSHAPAIEVKVKIPSFFWRVPILRNVTETIISKLVKG